LSHAPSGSASVRFAAPQMKAARSPLATSASATPASLAWVRIRLPLSNASAPRRRDSSDALGVDFDAKDRRADYPSGERLKAAHAAETGGENETTAQVAADSQASPSA